MTDQVEQECKELLQHWDTQPMPLPVLVEFVRKHALSGEWDDIRDEWTDQIFAAFPTRSGSHEEYAVAMEMVSHRYGKSALVALVNWLLLRISKADDIVRCVRALDGDPECLSDFWEDVGPRIKEYEAKVKP